MNNKKNKKDFYFIVNSRFDEIAGKYYGGKNEEALTLLEQLQKEHGDEIGPWYMHMWFGLVKQNLNRDEEAKSHFLMALDGVEPEINGLCYLVILDNLAFCCCVLGEDEIGLQYYDRAGKVLSYYDGPEWAIARMMFHSGKGRCLLNLGRNDEALDAFSAAEREIPNIPHPEDISNGSRYQNINIFKARAYHYSKDYDIAANLFDSLDPSLMYEDDWHDYYFFYGKNEVMRHNYSHALEIFLQYKEWGISSEYIAESYTLMGIAYYKCENYVESKHCFQESMKHPADSDWVTDKNIEFLKDLEDI